MGKIDEVLRRRLKDLRMNAGLSQREVAKELRISRSAYSQIETGERKVCAEELFRLAEIFEVDVNDLMDLKKGVEVILEEKKESKEKAAEMPVMRISVPQKNFEKFKEVLLYILNKIGSKANVGETVIYKLLYFIDFDYYEKYEEQLIGASYIKNKYGPTPVEFAKLVKKMVKEGEIEKVDSDYYSYPQTKYLPRRKPDLKKLSAPEIGVIDEVLNRLSDMNAAQISEYSHGDIPWLTTEDEEPIDYELVFYRNPPYNVREYDIED
jgi:transcriptional regulator with XRE-family HTH domain